MHVVFIYDSSKAMERLAFLHDKFDEDRMMFYDYIPRPSENYADKYRLMFETATHEWACLFNLGGYVYMFKSEADAVEFKLRFG
jgi:hypothetical protein